MSFPRTELHGLLSDLSAAVGLLVMMYPILCKVRYETLHRTFRAKNLWIQVAFSLVVNWILAPLFMVIHPQKHLVAVFIDNKYSWVYRGHFFPMKQD